MFTASYSPDDNKLRLYALSRLDAELYARVKAAGFSWAPRQELFVAPMWTPSREDLLLELAGEIDDEDTSLVERASDRADRFDGYSDNRRADANAAQRAVSAIADNIPLGQPILVGHHSERHARRDAEKIENGMRRAVKMWDTAQYWQDRAAGALHHAKYKELPAVRARRIKTIEADMRKQQRERASAEVCLKLWNTPMTHEQGLTLAGRHECGHLRLKRKDGDREDWNQIPTAYDGLSNHFPNLYAARTVAEVVEAANIAYPRMIARGDRWIAHYENRLAYERAMLNEQGGSDLLKPKARPAPLPICNYRQAETVIENKWRRGETMTLPQVEMTKAEYAAIYDDYKGTETVENSHRIRIAIVKHARVSVFLTDSKVHPKPETRRLPVPTQPPAPVVTWTPKEPDADAADFDAMRQSLKAGVQVVTAPQLFPTPPALAERMVSEAAIEPGMTVLEPSAGTGNLVRAVVDTVDTEIVGYEINSKLCSMLSRTFPSYRLCARQSDFLEVTEGMGQFPRIVMNPPFENGSDIRHIRHAVKFLAPGGRLVAICANGPRQRDTLKPLAEESGGWWEDLPADTFAASGTGVNTALLVIEG